MLSFLKKLFQEKNESEIPDPDYSALIERIKKVEESQEIAPGKRIHSFDYIHYEIRLDRDITKNYRVTIFQGNERVFSFTVFAEKGDFRKLEKAYSQIINFLKGNQLISKLPDSNLLKGYYFEIV